MSEAQPPAVPNAEADAILDQLVALARRIEEHEAAAALLRMEQLKLRVELRRSGWQPPGPGVSLP